MSKKSKTERLPAKEQIEPYRVAWRILADKYQHAADTGDEDVLDELDLRACLLLVAGYEHLVGVAGEDISLRWRTLYPDVRRHEESICHTFTSPHSKLYPLFIGHHGPKMIEAPEALVITYFLWRFHCIDMVRDRPELYGPRAANAVAALDVEWITDAEITSRYISRYELRRSSVYAEVCIQTAAMLGNVNIQKKKGRGGRKKIEGKTDVEIESHRAWVKNNNNGAAAGRELGKDGSAVLKQVKSYLVKEYDFTPDQANEYMNNVRKGLCKPESKDDEEVRRTREADREADEDREAAEAGLAPTVHEDIDWACPPQEIEDAMLRLDDEPRRLIELSNVHDLNDDEIARATDNDVKDVPELINDAMRDLRREVDAPALNAD